MLNPYYFTHRALQVVIKINSDGYNIRKANSKLTAKAKFPELGVKIG